MASDNEKRRGLHRLVAIVLRVVLGLLAWTLKVDLHGWEHVQSAMRSGRPVLLATWHGNILTLFLLRLHLQLPFLVGMISRSHDGDLAAEAVRPFGMFPVRGSSSRGGAPAVLAFRAQLRRLSDEGRAVAGIHLLDGPRGPRHKTKPGVLALARQNDALIVPLLTGAEPCRYARSWDRHIIPLPFSRLSLRFGAPIDAGDAPAEAATPDAPLTTASIDATLRQLAEEDALIAPTLELEAP